MEVHIRGNITDFAAVDRNFVSKHARSGDLNRIGPVVIVIAQGVGEVEDRLLRDL